MRTVRNDSMLGGHLSVVVVSLGDGRLIGSPKRGTTPGAAWPVLVATSQYTRQVGACNYPISGL
jgi:hypothetical protein